MIAYNNNSYEEMFGNIDEKTVQSSETCMSQCAGCMCNCRCSCSGGIVSDFEWDVVTE